MLMTLSDIKNKSGVCLDAVGVNGARQKSEAAIFPLISLIEKSIIE